MGSVRIQYTLLEDGAKIIGIEGRASVLRVPERIEGKPVTAVGAYAFAVAAELPKAEKEEETQLSFVPVVPQERKAPPKEAEGFAVEQIFLPDTVTEIGPYAFYGCTALTLLHLPEGLERLSDHLLSDCAALESVALPQGLREIEGYAFYGCRSLKKMILPETVEKIGGYAFYNCRNMEQIHIPGTTWDLGTGLFLNCDHLRMLSFGRCRHIADLISVLNQELHLTITFENGETAKLLLPDYQYEYIEDTPARQFHQVNYGTGHLFRQCIGNSDIDFRRFDELFYLTRREDEALMVLFLVMYRLEYPYRLQENRKADYLQYLKEHFLWAASYYISMGDLRKIRLFAQWGLLTAESTAALLKKAGEAKKTEITGFLLEYEHQHFQKKKKTFDL
ncbi:leucine-rich repeat domain-containing protein [Anaerotignum lactatifermentans]|uniref:Leucine-rich repeat domain-containing protein n=1 Tax=Anaerotignum lactatifermentans TaxID=160404 RepID=A0ABS2G9Q7_9FIRM|nr:leucine-rich repeat domain-containing protein [Anaerotignum lactatifermentans]MBM6829610.1 leucine-rich repeat domain-containing protein [Anaerotignum lactatifermentans]MBM6878201.1 leucine-rich repeat domain-containing protein [Anaerotignum lactatifermentans]MBM6951186.1 leucine-rich repeat domain-containing protein [Anaerotignum lactatifermentans]